MHTTVCRRASVALIACAMFSASCGIEKQTPPDLTGPSEFATSVTLTASPEIVARDGQSQSVITATVRNASGEPVAGRRLTLGLNPAIGGTLSAGEVVTNANGTASFVYTAPSLETPIDVVEVSATPSESNFDNAAPRNVAIALVGPALATPDFTVSPASPQQFQLVTLDGTTTMLEGQQCGSACTYRWDFGGEGDATGMVVTYRFRQQQSYIVTLTATSPGGVSARRQRSVVVSAGTLPTPAFTVSPTSPVVGQTIFMNASTSTAANGATVVDYQWNFGNGTTASGALTEAVFGAPGTYVVSLTIRDSNGMTATVTRNVIVAAP